MAEYSADAAGNSGHDSSSGDRDKAGHEGIFDKILSAAIPPDPHQNGPSSCTDHLSLLLSVLAARYR
jgi:hypothetical protein